MIFLADFLAEALLDRGSQLAKVVRLEEVRLFFLVEPANQIERLAAFSGWSWAVNASM